MLRFPLVRTVTLGAFCGCLLWAAQGHGGRTDRHGRPNAEINGCTNYETVQQEAGSVTVTPSEVVEVPTSLPGARMYEIRPSKTAPSVEIKTVIPKQVCTKSQLSCNQEEGFTWTEHGCLRRCQPSSEDSDKPRDPADSRDLKNCAPSEACLPLNGQYYCRLPCTKHINCHGHGDEVCYRGLCAFWRTADPALKLCFQSRHCQREEWCDRGGCIRRPGVGDSPDYWKRYCTKPRNRYLDWTQVSESTYQCNNSYVGVERTIVFDAPSDEQAVATMLWQRFKLKKKKERQAFRARLQQGEAPWPWDGPVLHRGMNKDGCEVYDSGEESDDFHSITVCKDYAEHRGVVRSTESPETAGGSETVLVTEPPEAADGKQAVSATDEAGSPDP